MAYPTLNKNEIYSVLYNQIIGISCKSDNIAGTFDELLNNSRIEGGLYGDTKLIIDTDALVSRDWTGDEEAANLLKIKRAPDPQTQAITINKFRVIELTLDQLLSKRAFGNEGQFSAFNSTLFAWLRDTKRVYDSTTYNTYVGTVVGGSSIKELTLNPNEYPSLGQGLGELIGDTLINLNDVTRDYNDYKHLKSFSDSDIIIVWNSKYLNQVKKIDLPALFHKDNLIDKFGQYVLTPRYFGTINTAKTAGDGSTVRSLIETDLMGTDGKTYHVFAADLIPETCSAEANESYTQDDNAICKIMHRDSIPFMSSFEIATSFFNPLAQATNNYIIWSHNELAYVKKYPLITIKKTTA